MKKLIKLIVIAAPLTLLAGCFEAPLEEVVTTKNAKEFKTCDEECERKRHEHFHSGELPDPTDGEGF